MRLYKAVWEHKILGSTLKNGWYRTKRSAEALRSMDGSGYMEQSPNYSFSITDRVVSLMEWLRGEPKTRK